MKKKSQLAFKNWFKKQYKKSPNRMKIIELLKEKISLQYKLQKVNDELNSETELLRNETAALYGWNAGKKK